MRPNGSQLSSAKCKKGRCYTQSWQHVQINQPRVKKKKEGNERKLVKSDAGLGRGGQRVVRAVPQRVRPVRPASRSQHVWPEVRMPPGVLGQVIRPHEALAAQGAGKLLLSGVRAEVARQLVGASKPLAALAPCAWEGALSCKVDKTKKKKKCRFPTFTK